MRPVETKASAPCPCLPRALGYRALAQLFRPPEPAGLDSLRSRELPGLEEALEGLGADEGLREEVARLRGALDAAEEGPLRRAYEETFEPSGGLRCPPHETAQPIPSPQHAMRRTFELADVAGFYRAFGVETVPGGERPDHVAVELEFMHLLAVKEAVAHGEAPQADEHLRLCREAQRSFLQDHLGQLAPALARSLAESAASPVYAAAGAVLAAFVAEDARRLGACTRPL